ncbi:hypothetical protein F0365_14160 [Nonlabens sp. Ci31]|jgi:hypothetical protein|uniref:hypothetical protein n=1 Tax=Nonlabens sp. Ci31 TaxID=2608253 RepID=UPI001462B07F|nr:hypothetical protein [Nonlabens sp. Ci31]QJP35462.1 hypothetical protein F0365_14160 [Nonlabens sp. Ci31]
MKIIQILLLAIAFVLFSFRQENTTVKDPIKVSEEMDVIQKYLFPTLETGNGIQEDFKGKGKFGSVHFLKFKPMADYTGIEVSDKQTGKTEKKAQASPYIVNLILPFVLSISYLNLKE